MANSTASAAPVGEKTRTNADIEHWDVENEDFWQREGKRIASRNLWISIPSLLMGFAIWLMWGMITTQMKNLGFPFSIEQLFTLSAIAGLSGATLRIPASFMIKIAGGRNTVFLTTALLMIPAAGTGIALMNPDTPFIVFQALALLSGIGGGNFACSMSNISAFYPKSKQGYGLGMNAGLGNFGVTTMQILIPLVMTVGIFGALAGDPMQLQSPSGTLIGRIEAGTDTWIQNAGFIWLVFLIPLAFAGWFGMNNLKVVTPNPGNPASAFAKILGLYGVGLLTSLAGVWALSVMNMWLALPLTIILTLVLLRLIPGDIKPNIQKQFAIFSNKHTWSMTVLYILTFGSFIGFSAALPLSISVIFGNMMEVAADGTVTRVVNPDAPSALTWAWMGPFVGALIRPVGGWISDKLGGSIVTQIISLVMVGASVATGYVMMLAYNSTDPNSYFALFLILFIVMFAASGIGNGSTFRSIGVIFDQQQKGPVLGWTSAVAAYGAFIAPRVMGQEIQAGTPEVAMYGFAVFYAVCLLVNWWFYLRRNAYIKNP
ncbi:MFS transporter, NNP family, nitrate/nitrite transporter [Marinobacter gudaonensis]|uniref:MFS transporter, NNP family, nitrate/nitrite transporter n=1 Tax=Marinobacter gudaonensis TaxID=375760 RepID=A0A1I6GSI8_9GAMM|nr:antiporter [Marinobacter gudaonensis]SFR45148.1 MFS transporter, NNP family, nitrate/nitrite transporter [Marinobacter gudaonensis]